MKIVYKKLIIIAAATFLLEAIIVYFLFTSINAYYSDLTNKIAFLLVDQVKNVIKAEKLNIYTISQYEKYPTRRLMNRLSGQDSEILHILLIDSTNHIVISDEPSVEGKVYTSIKELKLLDADRPTVVSRQWEDNEEILDVIYPLIENGVKQGYLRTVISVRRIEYFFKNRNIIIFIASLSALGIIILAVVFTSRIYQSNLKNIETAIEKLNESDFEYRVEYQKQDEFTPLFTRLNKLFEKTFDLNESYRKSEERIQALMEVIHEGIMIMDVEMKITSYNEYLLSILHISDHEGSIKQLYQIIQNNPRLLEIYRRARDPMTMSVKKALSLSLLDSSTIDVEVNALSLQENDKTVSVVLYIKNLGVLKELEQNLHRSMKYTVISQLASSIGHEIRNPLSSLAIHTEVVDNLMSQIPAETTVKSKVKKSINILNNEIGRLTKLIDQFFNLARPKEVDLEYDNINSVIKEVVELVQQEAYEKSVNLKVSLGKNLPPINFSRDQLKQVIINIILNAFDAMQKGGDLLLYTRERDNKVAVLIKDNGKGIPPDIQNKIFDLYFSTKRSGGGIGLAISKRIIEAHEGRIFFTSRENEGTTFVIELPRS